jgi:hypothetical protein
VFKKAIQTFDDDRPSSPVASLRKSCIQEKELLFWGIALPSNESMKTKSGDALAVAIFVRISPGRKKTNRRVFELDEKLLAGR